MSFHSKRTRADARRNETTQETNLGHTIIEENVHTNTNRVTNSPNDEQVSAQKQRISSSNWSGRQSGTIEDDENIQNREHSEIPDWSDTIRFDEQEKLQIRDKDGNSKVRGGTILPSNVWSLPPGDIIVVPFNNFYQPLRKGGHILVWFLGDIAKHGDLCPIGELNWHRVDKVVALENSCRRSFT